MILDLCLFDYPANRSGVNYEIIDEYFSRLQNIQDKIWAITLYEENPQSSIPLLQQMYDYIKEKWGGFRLYQFMGAEVPFSQYETLSADGYVVDPYALTQTDFEHYMDPIVEAGKQVVNIIYMAIESGYYYGDGHTWIGQIPYCYKNSIWTVIYAYYYRGLFQPRGTIPDLINRGYGGELKDKWTDILKARTYLLTGHIE